MKSRRENHNEIRIFHFDLFDFGMEAESVIREIDEADKVIMREPLDSVMIPKDVRNSTGLMKGVQHLQVSGTDPVPTFSKPQ